MRYQPNRDYVSDDEVQTPPALARALVRHFNPRGRMLEPCCGDGNFLRALRAFSCRAASPDPTGAPPPRVRQTSLDKSRAQRVLVPGPLSLVPGLPSPRASRVDWCEIKRGRDFFAWTTRVDWIITNPPWSQIRAFLQHGMRTADHVVFLLTINHVWTKARIRDIRTAGFGLREIVLVDMPPSFPQSGFQLGAVHVQRGWAGPITLTDWTADASTQADTHGGRRDAPPVQPTDAVPIEAAPKRNRRASEFGWIPELLRQYPATQCRDRVR